MAKKDKVHTVPDKETGTWKVKVGGETVSTHTTKKDALPVGKEVAKILETDHVIHKKNGEIGESNSYGNDPPKSKG